MKYVTFAMVISLIVPLLLCMPVSGTKVPLARDISAETAYSGTGYGDLSFLFDKDNNAYRKSSGNASIVLENEAGMASLYLMFQLEYGAYSIQDNTTGMTVTAGEHCFLHEYIDLEASFGTRPTSVTLVFKSGAVELCEIYVFSVGQLPDFVQTWQPPLEGGADLVLFSAHGDDEHLFFAGLLPLYAGEKGARVQVVYLTDHRNWTNQRTHEMLNGLWSVGVTAYPVFGNFADFRIDSLEGTYNAYQQSYGTSKTDLQAFVVEQIRRFKPLVAVSHDINGEYGHGMHMVYADLLIRSLEQTGDSTVFPESAAKYGTWELPKLYLHLYGENTIRLDYDQPLTAFDGLTAFEASQKFGYPCHQSQQDTWFTTWLRGYGGEITKATQIKTYSPCLFGLYHSTVGPDTEKNDFLENLTVYAVQQEPEPPQTEAPETQPVTEPAAQPQQSLPTPQTAPAGTGTEPDRMSIVLPVVIGAIGIFLVYAAVAAVSAKRRHKRRRRNMKK